MSIESGKIAGHFLYALVQKRTDRPVGLLCLCTLA